MQYYFTHYHALAHNANLTETAVPTVHETSKTCHQHLCSWPPPQKARVLSYQIQALGSYYTLQNHAIQTPMITITRCSMPLSPQNIQCVSEAHQNASSVLSFMEQMSQNPAEFWSVLM